MTKLPPEPKLTPGRKGRGHCAVCKHDARARIELHLARRLKLRTISAQFGIHRDSLYRHRKNHMPPELSAALVRSVPKNELDIEALRKDESEGLLQNLCAQRGRVLAVLSQAEDDGDYAAVSALHGRLTSIWKVEAEFLGELNLVARSVTNNILIAPAYLELRGGILSALQKYPEAGRAVAAVLHRTESQIIEHDSATVAA